MKDKVVDYINNNYYILRSIAKKITNGHQDYEELLQEVCLQILNKEKIELDDERNIKYYIVGLLRINYNSQTSPFHYNIRKERLTYDELPYSLGEDYDIEIEYDYTKEELIVAMEQSFQELDWFHRQLFETYMVMGSYAKVNELTKIPVGSVGMYINETKQMIKDKIKLKLNL